MNDDLLGTPRLPRHPRNARCQEHEPVNVEGSCIFLDPDTKEICDEPETNGRCCE